jgi:transposase
VNIDRATPMLLPCDLRDWLPPDHLVHFILEAVEQLPLGVFSCNARGTGSEQYPPAMMLALLIYCCATGRTGSRTMEAATHRDVAVRYLWANTHPDHATICEFRTQNEAAFKAAFVRVTGFRRFRLRGRPKVSLEWVLVCLSYNLKRMFVLQNQAVPG